MNKAKLILIVIFILLLPVTVSSIILITTLFFIYRFGVYVKRAIIKDNVSKDEDIIEDEVVLVNAFS